MSRGKNVMNKEYNNLIPDTYPLLRIRVLADGYPSGSCIVRVKPDTVEHISVPPEGNDAWCNASTWIQLGIQKVAWIDDRTLYCEAMLSIDSYLAGELTPVTLTITDHYCAPCGMLNFSKRIQERRNFENGEPIHSFSLVFEHLKD